MGWGCRRGDGGGGGGGKGGVGRRALAWSSGVVAGALARGLRDMRTGPERWPARCTARTGLPCCMHGTLPHTRSHALLHTRSHASALQSVLGVDSASAPGPHLPPRPTGPQAHAVRRPPSPRPLVPARPSCPPRRPPLLLSHGNRDHSFPRHTPPTYTGPAPSPPVWPAPVLARASSPSPRPLASSPPLMGPALRSPSRRADACRLHPYVRLRISTLHRLRTATLQSVRARASARAPHDARLKGVGVGGG